MAPLVLLVTIVNGPFRPTLTEATILQVCSGAERRQHCADGCGGVYSPVCGSDGVTYSNQCFFDIAQCHDHTLTLAHPGACGSGGGVVVKKKGAVLPACPDVLCFDLYAPVCGTDGKTYSNTCYLTSQHCHGAVTVAHQGACGSDGTDELLVSKRASDCPMMACIALYAPVCGSDGITYGNICMLHTQHCHGDVTLAYDGTCV